MSLLLLRRKRRRSQPSSGAWPPPPPLPFPAIQPREERGVAHLIHQTKAKDLGRKKKEEGGGLRRSERGEREREEKNGDAPLWIERKEYIQQYKQNNLSFFFHSATFSFQKAIFFPGRSQSVQNTRQTQTVTPHNRPTFALNLFSSSLTLRSKVGLSRNNLTDQGWRDKGCLYSCCCCFCSHSEGH